MKFKEENKRYHFVYNVYHFLCNFCNLLKRLPSYLPKLKESSFGSIGSVLAINFIAFWGVEPCNSVDYMSVVVEHVTWALRNFEMCFDYVPFDRGFNWTILIPRNLRTNRKLLRNLSMEASFWKHDILGSVLCKLWKCIAFKLTLNTFLIHFLVNSNADLCWKY
jgi:hypothetical protein